MHVEFFGVPRERAGVSELEVHADTLGQLLGTLAARMPSLCRDHRARPAAPGIRGQSQRRPLRHATRRTPLGADDCVLILSADAGG